MSGSAGSTVARLRRSLGEETPRRLVHTSGSVLPLLYVLQVATWLQVRLLFVAASVCAAVLEVLRLSVGLDWRIYDRLTRGYEQDNLAGYAYYTFSTTAVVLAFEPRVAIPAVLMLTVGDPISGMAGSGELRRVKRPAALAAMFCTSVALAAPFLPRTPLAVALGALAATVADGVKPTVEGYIIDDNLTIPPAAAGAMWAGIELTAAFL
jgi:dolichol kinase